MESQSHRLAMDILHLTKKLESSPEDASLRFRLLSQIAALHHCTRSPSYTTFRDIADMTRIKATSALLQHGVLQSIPKHGFIGARELSRHASLEEGIIVRLMRHLTAFGIIDLGQSKEPAYAHTRLSRHWLTTGGPEYTQLMAKDIARPDLGNYFVTHNERAVQDPHRSPSTRVEDAEGQDWFEFISRDPSRVANFAAAMEFAEDFILIFGMYQFERLVDVQHPEKLPLIVDVGGGRGQALKAIKETLPGLKGRLICQDKPEVIASCSQSDVADIEMMAHNFFTAQPIRGARIYYLRRVTHDWDDASILKIFSQIAAAMSSDSRILVNHLVIPDRAAPGTDLTAYWMDYSVMFLGGKERTELELIDLLDQAGLEHVQTWKMDVSAYAVIEAKLKSAQEEGRDMVTSFDTAS